MKLLTKKIAEAIPTLYKQESKKDEAVVYVKFFSPYSDWTWYVLEGRASPEVYDEGDKASDDYKFFGVVVGFEVKYGYFALSELEGAKREGLPLVERDLHFQPTKLKDIQDRRLQEFLERM